MINNTMNNSLTNFYFPQQTNNSCTFNNNLNNFYYPQQTTNNYTINNIINYICPQQSQPMLNYLSPQCINNSIYIGMPQPTPPNYNYAPVNNFQQNGTLMMMMLPMIMGLFGSLTNLLQGTQKNNKHEHKHEHKNGHGHKRGNNKESNNIVTIINIIINNITKKEKPEEAENVEEVEEVEKLEWANEGLHSLTWGDPHFGLTEDDDTVKVQAFDFQGSQGGVYNMIANDDFTLNAKFNAGTDEDSRIITDQNLTLKGSDVNIVSHRNGKFDIYHDGEKIGDESNYEDLKDDPRLEGIDISFNPENKNTLTVKYKDREINQQLVNAVNNLTSVTSDDTGMLTQLVGALDKENLLDNKAEIDVNNDGKISDDEVFEYTSSNQAFVRSINAALSAAVKIKEEENYNDLSNGFLNSAMDHKNQISRVFDGAFEGADEITESTDSRLTIKEDDSEGVIAAKEAMKATLELAEEKIEKDEAVEKVANWLETSTNEINNDYENAEGSIANGFKEFDGYSRSQWNEFVGEKLFSIIDNIFV